MNDLPYRFSERHFRYYEPFIKAVVEAWPNVTYIDPKLGGRPLSCETFRCRFRDAMTSLREHQWQSTVPIMKFVQIAEEITVSTNAVHGKVAVGPYDRLRKSVPLGAQVENIEVQPVPPINLEDPSDDLIQAVIVLHHYHILVEPSRITTAKDLAAYEKQYPEVVIEKQGTHYTIY